MTMSRDSYPGQSPALPRPPALGHCQGAGDRTRLCRPPAPPGNRPPGQLKTGAADTEATGALGGPQSTLPDSGRLLGPLCPGPGLLPSWSLQQPRL